MVILYCKPTICTTPTTKIYSFATESRYLPWCTCSSLSATPSHFVLIYQSRQIILFKICMQVDTLGLQLYTKFGVLTRLHALFAPGVHWRQYITYRISSNSLSPSNRLRPQIDHAGYINASTLELTEQHQSGEINRPCTNYLRK